MKIENLNNNIRTVFRKNNENTTHEICRLNINLMNKGIYLLVQL